MEINYSNNSFKSKIIKILIRLSGFKKNTSSITNIQKHISKCINKKINKKFFRKMTKLSYNGYTFYTWNGNVENSRDSFLLYIHGGSFIDKPLNIQLNFVKKVAKKLNSTLIVPLYKTIPTGNSQKLLEEMKVIYQMLLKQHNKIYLIGDSAGGGAALSLNLVLKEEKISKPSGTILLSPWLDLSLSNPKIVEKKDIVCSIPGNKYCGKIWADEYDIKDYKVSPIYGNFDNLNKVFISCGGNEICQPDCIKLVEKLKAMKINYKFVQFENQFHNFELYPIIESKILIDEIYKYILGGC